jgi:lipoprotein-anchoring transpeptidase ErfK/SrfK
VRYCIGCALAAVSVAAASSGQTVAQTYNYPPPAPRADYGRPPIGYYYYSPGGYYYYYGPSPGGYYPPLPPSYGTPPVAPAAEGAPAPEPSYGPGYPQAATATPGYPPSSGPYYGPTDRIAGLPLKDQPESNQTAEPPPQFRRQIVAYATTEPAGTIIIDTSHTFLYLMLGHGRALRYGIGVGRNGFTWSGTERISRMSKWPDWHPPKEMIGRQPYLPRFTAGGEGNPLGARALYLGDTEYRIHGTNQPSTIGHFVSSGCIRLTNEDVEDLYNRVSVGTRVVVLPGSPPVSASAQVAR